MAVFGGRQSYTQWKSQHPVNWKATCMVKTNEKLMIHKLYHVTVQSLEV